MLQPIPKRWKNVINTKLKKKNHSTGYEQLLLLISSRFGMNNKLTYNINIHKLFIESWRIPSWKPSNNRNRKFVFVQNLNFSLLFPDSVYFQKINSILHSVDFTIYLSKKKIIPFLFRLWFDVFFFQFEF